MKILHINLAKGFRGGERQTLLLVIELSGDPEVEQFVLLRKGSPLVEKMAGLANVTVIQASKPFIVAIPKIPVVDLVHAHEAHAVKWAFFFRLFTRTPYILTRRIMKMPSQNFLTRPAYLGASSIVALSTAVKEVMVGYGVIGQIPVIPDAFASLSVTPAKVTELEARWQGKTIVGHVGALVDSDKGQSYIIDAAREAQRRNLDFYFVLVGEGKDRLAFLEQSKGLLNIEFCGFQTDIGSYLKAFSYFVFPSLREGLGSSILDAMHAGLPVVASDVGGIPDLVQSEVTGILIPARNSEAILGALLKLQVDEVLRQTIVENAKQRLALFSPKSIAMQYKDVYTKLIP